MNYIFPVLTSFLLTVLITPLVIRWATACGCLDKPGDRRLHNNITPLWGGMAFFAGILPALMLSNQNGTLSAYLIAAFLLVVMGMVDDLVKLGWKIKFAIISAATAIVIFGGDVIIHQIGNFGPWGQLELGAFSIPFTFFCIIGITNAINLLDGLDGLAGGVSLLGFLFIGIAALNSGDTMLALICFAFVGGLAGFLPFNFPHARIFMGDTGSIFLGFSLATVAIMLTQDNSSRVDAMFPVLLLLIPIFDTIRVILVRIRLGRNPFKGDNLHLHYLMLQSGQASFSVVLQLWGLTLLFGSIALTMSPPYTFTYLLVAIYAVCFLAIFSINLSRQCLRGEECFIRGKRGSEIGIDGQ